MKSFLLYDFSVFKQESTVSNEKLFLSKNLMANKRIKFIEGCKEKLL